MLSLVLSDVLGDPLDMIASGPAAPDTSTSREALALAGRYALPLSDAARACLARETPKALDNVESEIIGSVSLLCASAADTARALGYDAAKVVLTAIETAGATDSHAVCDAMKATSLDCVTGHITFDEHCDPIKSAYIKGFVDGVPTLLKRIDP